MNLFVDIGHAHRTGARGYYESPRGLGGGLDGSEAEAPQGRAADGAAASQGAEIEEHALCTVIAPWVKKHLEACGHRVDIIDFPNESNRVDLNKTIAAVNQGGYDFGVSLHCDWSESATAHGAHACYVSTGGHKLAECIMRYLGNLMPGRAEQVVKRTDLAILNRTRPVVSLIECGFISNKPNAGMLINCPEHIARAIAKGILDYINHLEFA